MNKKIISIAGILVLIVALFFVIKNVSFAPATVPVQEPESQPEGAGKEKTPETGAQKIKIDPNISDMTLPLSNNPKDVAWALFQKYLSFNKSKNLEGVKSTVYRVAPVCEDSKTRIDCEGRMGSAYAYGSALKKEDFTNVWSDEKQIILATDFKIQEDDTAIGRNRAIIFFVKNEQGDLRMLSFSPFKGAVVSKGAASREELIDRITTYTEDNDNDGLADYDEQCLGIAATSTCVKTSPKLRDSNNNGLWDGIEALMK